MDKKDIIGTKNSLAFIKEVAKYFMDFLETDFHKRKNPKRSVQLRNSDNLLIGLNLNKYPSFNSQVSKLICSGFNKSITKSIEKGVYKTNIPTNLIDLIKLQTEKVTKKQIKEILEKISEEIEKASVLHKKEYDQALSLAMEETSKAIKADLVIPFVSNLEKPIETLNLGDENSIYLMEEELTAILSSLLENKISEVVKMILAKEKVNISTQLENLFELKDVKTSITSFFEAFQVGDLFSEIYEIERNRTILDKQEFYLYFCDISFNKVKYPIFYIPLSINKQNDSFEVEFDSQVYVNKKAIEFIVQEFNKEKERKGDLKGISERIIYLAQHQEDFKDIISEILAEIVNFFELDKNIDISSNETQVSKSLLVRASNSFYLTLFDKSDEALVNDYEEILQLLSSDDNILAGAFNTLIEDFIQKDPKSFNLEIEESWNEKEVPEKLVFESPIPLNSEQLQILSALKNDECKYIIVQGPPGTGKSHTITAVIFNAILKNQSILVLSDKKEALDVVEDKITETLNKVRADDNFQNPVLRLGKIGNAYSKILSPISMKAITNNYLAVKKNYNDLEDNIGKNLNGLKEDIEAEIITSKEIDLQEIYEFFKLESDFETNGFPLEIDELRYSNDSGLQLEDLRSAMNSLKDKLSDNTCNLQLATKPTENEINLVKSKIEIVEGLINSLNEFIGNEDIKKYSQKIFKSEENFGWNKFYFEEIRQYEDYIDKSGTLIEVLSIEKPKQIWDITKLNEGLKFIKKILDELSVIYGNKLYEIDIPVTFSDINYQQIDIFTGQYQKNKLPIIGYLFHTKEIEAINNKFKTSFNTSDFDNPHKYLNSLKQIKIILDKVSEYKANLPESLKNIDLSRAISILVKNNNLKEELNNLILSNEKYINILNEKIVGVVKDMFSINSVDDLQKFTLALESVEQYKKYTDSELVLYKSNVKDISSFLSKEIVTSELNNLKKLDDVIQISLSSYEDIDYINSTLDKYPKFTSSSGIENRNTVEFTENNILKISPLDFSNLSRYLSLSQKIHNNFADVPELNYSSQKKCIEDLLTIQMANIMDKRVIDFDNNYKATASALKKIIQSKTKFPRDEFMKLKNAFPCILAGIRDYAEFIPLEPDLFDLVIIDEASQVSVAQAFPALLRAKKILILGDKKQFSNVKTAQARGDENRKYLSQLKDSFVKNISSDGVKLVKLEKFNIKTSILEFFEFISNYNTQLLKHFRGYKEIISYSNKYFYQSSLQVMKIRGKSINEVLRFENIKHDGKSELIPNTNTLEVEFIVSELIKLKESGSTQSVGIITPHTNQQKRIVEIISKVPEKDYFYEKLKLKIMTFDTCQGEERDTIFYSMVATIEDDHLWGVFIKDLSNVDSEEDGKIKAQRLNVGFSRAKECMYFVLSKPIEKFNGSIGDALMHYWNVLEESKKEHGIAEVDKNSKMEPEVMNWFYQTNFWTNHKEDIEFIPQFELGKYLNQLDKTYSHPKYKVDFLLIYKDEVRKNHKIIIEYDGFKEHFRETQGINSSNFEEYYSAEDVYRQKTLESYGYKFLRINKFNIGKDPINTLNTRIEELIKNGDFCKNDLLTNIHKTINNLQNGEIKPCPKCKMVRSAEDFKDNSLISGYGRFCKYCKGNYYASDLKNSFEKESKERVCTSCKKEKNIASFKNENGYLGTVCNECRTDQKLCPLCNSNMVLRSGRYGKFFGCSKFPYCKGTRKY